MRILIWGTGALVKRYMRLQYFYGQEIIGFIDSYKDDKFFLDYPVYRPQEISLLEYDYLLICVLKENLQILKTCIDAKVDLKKTLFVSGEKNFEGIDPTYVQQLLSKENIIDSIPIIYREMKEKESKNEYYNFVLEEKLKDVSLISELGENHVIAWIPVELLFTQRGEDNFIEDKTDEWKKQNKRWENIPIVSLKPHNNLMQFFMVGKNYPFEYCEWYQELSASRGLRSGYSNDQLIEKRFREFMVMQRELNKGMEFFIEHPVFAVWNSKGYFNLIDGHHRVMFLYHSGLTKVPAQIAKKDYEFWRNSGNAKIVQKTILKQKRKDFYQPILNPYFLDIRPYREAYSKSRLHHILEYLGHKRFSGKKVIDIGANLGYMGQAFYRMGAEVTLLEPDIFHYELTKKINELLYTKCDVITKKFEEYDTKEKYDIGILLTVFYHYFGEKTIREKFIQCLEENITEMVIWESGWDPEEEKEYIISHTKFHNYIHLAYTYATGKFRELGIFLADNSEFLC